MSIDSVEKSEDIIEEEESSMEVEEEQSQEQRFAKGSRITKANKDIEAMETNEKSVNKYIK